MPAIFSQDVKSFGKNQIEEVIPCLSSMGIVEHPRDDPLPPEGGLGAKRRVHPFLCRLRGMDKIIHWDPVLCEETARAAAEHQKKYIAEHVLGRSYDTAPIFTR